MNCTVITVRGEATLSTDCTSLQHSAVGSPNLQLIAPGEYRAYAIIPLSNKLVGYALAKINEGGINVEITEVEIHQQYRHCGLCTVMISHLIAYCKAFHSTSFTFTLMMCGGYSAFVCYVKAFKINGYSTYNKDTGQQLDLNSDTHLYQNQWLQFEIKTN